jgi:hypothetical protein
MGEQSSQFPFHFKNRRGLFTPKAKEKHSSRNLKSWQDFRFCFHDRLAGLSLMISRQIVDQVLGERNNNLSWLKGFMIIDPSFFLSIIQSRPCSGSFLGRNKQNISGLFP